MQTISAAAQGLKEMASGASGGTTTVPGVLQKPLEEAKAEYERVRGGAVNADSSSKSFVRHGYEDECENGVNAATNLFMNLWHISSAGAAYFAGDAVALPGVASFFGTTADRALLDAKQFLDFQNLRGGKVVLASVAQPPSDFFEEAQGDALHAFTLLLALHKHTFAKLRELDQCAQERKDPQLSDFVKTKLHETALAIRELGSYVCELKRVGKGHGVFHFDRRVERRHGLVLSATVKLPTAV